MAGSLREIQAKIASTKKTSQITGAMQMVSASKLTRSEQAAKDFQIYASKIRQITTDLLHSGLMVRQIQCWMHAQFVRQVTLSLLQIKDLLEVITQPFLKLCWT